MQGTLVLHRKLDPARPPVVLLGSINLTRAIGLAGIPVIVASSDPLELGFHSRYCHGRYLLPPWSDPGAVAHALRKLGRALAQRLGRRVALAYARDDYLRFVYEHREMVEREFLVLLNSPEVGPALLDKGRFAELAARAGLPVPRTYGWRDLEARPPGAVVVKPSAKMPWGDLPLLPELFDGETKALIFEDAGEILGHPAIARFHERLVFQEYIAGDDERLWCFDGVADEAGAMLAGYAGRKLRTFPPLAGESSFIEIAANPELEALARDIAARLPLRGIFNMDFKQDARTGRYYLLEINGRFNMWLYMAARNGMHLTRVLFDYLEAKRRPASLRHRDTYRWLDFKLDRQAYRALSRQGRLTFPRWCASLLASRKVYSVFSWSDPWPFAHLWIGRARRGVNNARLRRWAK